mmetsp:Transcript_34759/g.102173  ORF Transcript_34759/g.102173 Transcript_34759/m.102173 type:complete len:212 (+) Transcript_34759:5184-5819(+)
MLLRTDELRIVLDMLNETIVKVRHLEEVAGFLNLLQRLAANRVFVIGQLSIGIGNEGLLSHIVPPTVRIKVNITSIRATLPQGLRSAHMALGCGANVVIIRDQDALIEALEPSHVLVTQFNRLGIVLGGGLGNFLAVLISAGDELDPAITPTTNAGVSGQRIGRRRLVCVTHMGRAVRIVDGRGDVIASFRRPVVLALGTKQSILDLLFRS